MCIPGCYLSSQMVASEWDQWKYHKDRVAQRLDFEGKCVSQQCAYLRTIRLPVAFQRRHSLESLNLDKSTNFSFFDTPSSRKRDIRSTCNTQLL